MYVISFYLYLFVLVDCCLVCDFFFFFKQKTAYEMRISDWSSDVCSSDLRLVVVELPDEGGQDLLHRNRPVVAREVGTVAVVPAGAEEIGRASCRERVCQYV